MKLIFSFFLARENKKGWGRRNFICFMLVFLTCLFVFYFKFLISRMRMHGWDAHAGFRHTWLSMRTHPKPKFGKFLSFI